ncbi:MAG TPA: hypothetical protein VJG90_05875 [Candidatus Nanoarchaeia archaeon]|nr:hypothetical protein [Candidatus Nanoarchaeia archaeon]
MDKVLEGYRRAHESFRGESLEECSLDQPVMIEYLDALASLSKKVWRVVPIGQDRRAQVLSAKGWLEFRKEFPEEAAYLVGYREECRSKLRSLRRTLLNRFSERFDEAPFSEESVDVLVERGLRVSITPLEDDFCLIVGAQDYSIHIDPKIRIEDQRCLLARSLVGLYYNVDDWEVIIPEVGALHTQAGLLPTPLEKELRYLARDVLDGHSNLLNRWIPND